MKSIRFYLIAVLLSTVCVVTFLAVLHGYRNSLQVGKQTLDDELARTARSLAITKAIDLSTLQAVYADNFVYQLWQGEQLIQSSQNIASRELAQLSIGFHMINHERDRWRVFVHQDAHNIQVIFGQRVDQYSKLLESMIIKSILPIIWVLPLLGILIWMIISYGLKPLDRLSETLQRRRAGELSAVNGDSYPDELSPVVESINKLFVRLSSSFERERNFASDAAHELRTPLAAVKVSLHNLVKEIDLDPASVFELSASTDRMGYSIEQILTLNRLGKEQFYEGLSDCNLESIIQSVIVELYEEFTEKNQQIQLNAEDIVVQGNEFALFTLFRNLIDNASKYSPVNDDIQISVKQLDDKVEIIIEDSGSGIPQQDYQRVFDRFYRATSNDSTVTGSGLGLSIVKHIVELHSGQIDIGESPSLGGLMVKVALPIYQDVQVEL